MTRILVILHIYYHEQVDYFISRLRNINGCEWDLTVTGSSINEDTVRKILSMKPDAEFLTVENSGYDVWPFIQAVRAKDISGYDLIMKLHTKNVDKFKWKINGLKLTGESWRDLLVDSMLSSEEQFRKCLMTFRNNPDTGMVCSYELCVLPSHKFAEDTCMLTAEGQRIGIPDARKMFCAGTMFMTRPECLKKIREASFEASSWESSNASHSMATLAHVYERIFGAAVYDAGYTIKGLPSNDRTYRSVRIHQIISPLLKGIFNLDYIEGGRKCLTVFGLKFPL